MKLTKDINKSKLTVEFNEDWRKRIDIARKMKKKQGNKFCGTFCADCGEPILVTWIDFVLRKKNYCHRCFLFNDRLYLVHNCSSPNSKVDNLDDDTDAFAPSWKAGNNID